MKLSDILKDLQLTPIEERVYLTLLSSGQMSIPEIADHLKESVSNIESSVTSLRSKELVFTNPSIISKHTAMYPLVSLADKAKDSMDTIKAIGDEINAYAEDKVEKVERILKQQKVSIQSITTSAKDEVRVSTAVSTGSFIVKPLILRSKAGKASRIASMA